MKIPSAILIALVLALQGSNAVPAQDTLGRLFYTAKQRAALDANVRSNTLKPERPVPLRPSVTLNGIVTRSDGEQTVWIDGRAYHRGSAGDVRVKPSAQSPATAEIELRDQRRPVELRVGQTYRATSGAITEVYESGVVRTETAKPAGAGETEASRNKSTSNSPAAPEQVSDN